MVVETDPTTRSLGVFVTAAHQSYSAAPSKWRVADERLGNFQMIGPVRSVSYRVIRKMKIAQVAPLYESCPPQLYGGTERVVSYLTEELVRQGHEVTLFASGDSQTTATLRAPLRAGVAPRSPMQGSAALSFHITASLGADR